MRFIINIAVLMIITLSSQPSFAVETSVNSNVTDMAISKNGAFASEKLEARATHLFRAIKCPICVAQSVAESDAEISKSLRNHIRKEIVAGKTDQQILDNLILRYGDSILLKPPVEASTLPLWLAPWFFLLVGFGIWRHAHNPKNKSISP